jgi:hypothetical protein
VSCFFPSNPNKLCGVLYKCFEVHKCQYSCRLCRLTTHFPGVNEVLTTPAWYGTHELAKRLVSVVHDDFTNRKGNTTQNVVAICDFDMRFTYVGVGT